MKKISNLYIKKYYEDKHVDLLLIEEKDKNHYVFTKDLNTFMFDQTLNLGKKTFLSFLFTSFKYRRNIKTSY